MARSVVTDADEVLLLHRCEVAPVVVAAVLVACFVVLSRSTNGDLLNTVSV